MYTELDLVLWGTESFRHALNTVFSAVYVHDRHSRNLQK